MTTEFSDFNLHSALIRALAELGYTTPTPIQSGMIPLMLSGVDVIGQAQTGTGKTAAFALPILHNYQSRNTPQALVLAPTRELALQVAEAVQGYGRHLGAQVLAVYGGQGFGQQIKQLRRGVDIVVGTPGRLLDLLNRNILDLSGIKTVVLDEADEMLKMGFIDDVEAILAKTPETRQTALFSATVPAPIRRLADKYMRAPQSVTIQRNQVTAVAIEQRYYLVRPSDKVAALTRILEHEDVKRGLIFARTRIGTAELAAALTRQGFPAETLNGDLTQEARERVLHRFRNNQIQILVATDVAARGLDIDDISHVFNHDLPSEVEVYVHRIGRTGRASKTGIAISLITPAEHAHLRRIEAFTRQKFLRATLPSVEDIMQRRSAQLTEQVTVWLKRGRINRERAHRRWAGRVGPRPVGRGRRRSQTSSGRRESAHDRAGGRSRRDEGGTKESVSTRTSPRRLSRRQSAVIARFFPAGGVEACSAQSRRQGFTRNRDGSADLRRRQNPRGRAERSCRHHRLSRRYPRQCDRQDPHRKPKVVRRCARSARVAGDEASR